MVNTVKDIGNLIIFLLLLTETGCTGRRIHRSVYEFIPSPPRNACRTSCTDGRGNDYAGTISNDYLNFTCKRWDTVFPDDNTLGTRDEDFPCDGSRSAAKNYCRAINRSVPWCYTEFGFRDWSYCSVPRCEPPPACYPSCTVGPKYGGKVAVTRLGEKCQRWDANVTSDTCFDNSDFPCDESQHDAGKYCRAPDGDPRGAWCYTNENKTTWDYCVVPWCDRNCGSRYVSSKRRIIGGNKALYGEIPWQALVLKGSNYGEWVFLRCGGTIINEWWIVSAAHCFRNAVKERFVIRVGVLEITSPDEYEQSFEIDTLIMHESFDASRSRDYDIALIKVKPVNGMGIQFNHIVQPACLGTASTLAKVYSRKRGCIISGWGRTETALPRILQVATVPLIEDAVCKKLHGIKAVTSRMMCAGFLEGGIDACSSDSGGPLVCMVDGKYTLMGITSWGRGCAQPNRPGVYTKVSEFWTWINRNIKEHTGKRTAP